jgi:hypothetical protein
MTLPSLILGLIVALLIGALFHLWRGGGLGRLLLYLVLSVTGSAAGQLLGSWRNWSLLSVGPLDLGLASLASLAFLFLGYWLSLIRVGRIRDEDDRV